MIPAHPIVEPLAALFAESCRAFRLKHINTLNTTNPTRLAVLRLDGNFYDSYQVQPPTCHAAAHPDLLYLVGLDSAIAP